MHVIQGEKSPQSRAYFKNTFPEEKELQIGSIQNSGINSLANIALEGNIGTTIGKRPLASAVKVGLARSPKPFGKAESKPPLSGTKTPLDKEQTK